MAKKRPAGIDLGTTFSVAAWVDQTGRTALIANSEGEMLTPSAVLFQDDTLVVGKEAKKAGVLRPARLALWVKRDMGSPVYSQPIDGVYLPPEVIQACILNKLRADIVRAVGPDAAVVITVPAFFDDPRRRATIIAGQIAGLGVLDIVNEPTAAALAFGEHLGMLGPGGTPQGRINILVYDLGGGTFDVTLLEVHPSGFRTIATDGDVQLGGRDWDMRLVDLVSQDFVKKFREDPRENPVSLQRLLTEVEHAKHTLSGRQRATVQVDHAGNSHEVKVSRQEFEEVTADLLERTRLTTQQLLAAGKLEWKDVSRLLLVGGSTRMPMVSKMLQDLSGITPDYTVNPDEAVARGAALSAKYLLDSAAGGPLQPKYRVTNVNAHSLGIEGIEQDTLDKVNTVLIPRNTPLPAKATETFVTKVYNQRSIAIRVLEGESAIPGECTLIGRTVIKNLPPNLPKGHPVEVTYEYAANGRLSVRARVPGTDQ